jgi:hypothetical protein
MAHDVLCAVEHLTWIFCPSLTEISAYNSILFHGVSIPEEVISIFDVLTTGWEGWIVIPLVVCRAVGLRFFLEKPA